MIIGISHNSVREDFTICALILDRDNRREGFRQGHQGIRVNIHLAGENGLIFALALAHVFVDAVLDDAGPHRAIIILPSGNRGALRLGIFGIKQQFIESIRIPPDKGKIVLLLMLPREPIGTTLDNHLLLARRPF